jgi:hypothetical protein
MAKYQKLLKTKDGKYNYHFNWIGGGFNDVWAKNKKEAIKEIARQFTVLKPDLSTMYKATQEEADAMNRLGWMMSC